MFERLHHSKKKTSQTNPSSKLFESSPFVSRQPASHTEPPDLQPHLENPQHFAHHLANIPLSPPNSLALQTELNFDNSNPLGKQPVFSINHGPVSIQRAIDTTELGKYTAGFSLKSGPTPYAQILVKVQKYNTETDVDKKLQMIAELTELCRQWKSRNQKTWDRKENKALAIKDLETQLVKEKQENELLKTKNEFLQLISIEPTEPTFEKAADFFTKNKTEAENFFTEQLDHYKTPKDYQIWKRFFKALPSNQEKEDIFKNRQIAFSKLLFTHFIQNNLRAEATNEIQTFFKTDEAEAKKFLTQELDAHQAATDPLWEQIFSLIPADKAKEKEFEERKTERNFQTAKLSDNPELLAEHAKRVDVWIPTDTQYHEDAPQKLSSKEFLDFVREEGEYYIINAGALFWINKNQLGVQLYQHEEWDLVADIGTQFYCNSPSKTTEVPQILNQQSLLKLLRQEDQCYVVTDNSGTNEFWLPAAQPTITPKLKKQTTYVIAPAGTQYYSAQKTNKIPTDFTLKFLREESDYYVTTDASSTQEYWILKQQTGVEKRVARFEKKTENLLDKDPAPEDVVQTNLGDCYLQAALASIAAKNPDVIKQMMRDQKDTVTVRLYEVDETNPSAPKYTPKFIKVEKSIPKDAPGAKLYNEGALWVRMIQKAYAVGGFTGTLNTPPKTLKPSYENIVGGFANYAFKVLLGQGAKTLKIQGSPEYNISTTTGDFYAFHNKAIDRLDWAKLPWDGPQIDLYDKVKAGPTPTDYTSLMVYQQIFTTGDQNKKVDTWMNFVKTGVIQKMLKDQYDEHHKTDSTSCEITLSSFEKLFKDKSLDSEVTKDVMRWLEISKFFPGELGTHQYSKTQLDTFEDIKEALNNGKFVALGSYKYLTKGVTTGTGVSGGEQKYGGLAGSHEYSVFNVQENVSENPNKSPQTAGEFYWIQIRNPWGEYERDYDLTQTELKNRAKKSNTGKGIFWLELSDLSRYFNIVHIS